MPEQIQVVFESLKIYWEQLLYLLPKVLIGIVLFIAGWFVAKLIKFLLIKFLRIIRLDSVAEKAGIEDILLKGGIQHSSVIILANIIYWCLLFGITLAILDSLGLKAAQGLFNQVLEYIPNVIIAVLVLVFGVIFAKFLRSTVYTYLTNINVSGAELISSACYWIMMLLIIFTALHQLSIGGQLLIFIFEVGFASICFAFAIAFGLAGKEWAIQILEKIWRKTR